ncbi:MAG: hypothetical protein AB8E82_07155 [Aureispira sp.]
MSSNYNKFAARTILLQQVLFVPILLSYSLAVIFESGLILFGLLFQLILAFVQILLSIWHVVTHRSTFHKKHLRNTIFYFFGVMIAFFIIAIISIDSLAIVGAILCFCIIPTLVAGFFIYKSKQLKDDPNFPPAPEYTYSDDLLDDF